MIITLFVAGRGYDPRTSGLWIRRSNQLSYPAIHITFVLESGCKGMKKKSYLQIIIHFFAVYSLKTFFLCVGYCRGGDGLLLIIIRIEDMLLSKNTILIYAY